MARHLFSRGIGRFVPAGFDLAAYAGAERMGAAGLTPGAGVGGLQDGKGRN